MIFPSPLSLPPYRLNDMLTPIIERFSSPLSPWEVYQNLEGLSAGSTFFLDSVEYRPPNQRYSYLGMDPFLEVKVIHDRIKISGAEETNHPVDKLFEVLRGLFQQYRVDPGCKNIFFTGGAVGFWSYELAAHFDKIRFRSKPKPDIPLLSLGFYRDLIVYDHRDRVYWLATHFSKGKRTEMKIARRNLNRLKSFFSREPVLQGLVNPGLANLPLRNFRAEISRSEFETMVRKAKTSISAGEIYQANLSQRFSFDYDGSPLALYGCLRKINPSPFSAYLKMGDLTVISSSPERLIRKRGSLCETRPIAGTRPVKLGSKSLHEVEEDLLANEKERAEHIMLVDLERNDLGRVCDFKSVHVEEMMTIERYSHVIHIVSKIVGKLRQGKDGLDLIRAVFPGGTITGCPKIRCMEIIDELEPVGRGLYTGSLGWIDFKGDLDLNIVIRTILLRKEKGHFQVGAGIVHDSHPLREYEETLHKGEALAEALAQASVGAGVV